MDIRGIANSWFQNYLSGRKQFIEMYDLKSSMELITCGFPQGSILGIYVNDICNSTTLNILRFADDTTISKSHHDINELYRGMNQELKLIHDIHTLPKCRKKHIYTISSKQIQI